MKAFMQDQSRNVLIGIGLRQELTCVLPYKKVVTISDIQVFEPVMLVNEKDKTHHATLNTDPNKSNDQSVVSFRNIDIQKSERNHLALQNINEANGEMSKN